MNLKKTQQDTLRFASQFFIAQGVTTLCKSLKISTHNSEAIEKLKSEKQNFSKSRNIGVVFSGGPAPGGHNVIAGIYDETKKYNSDSRVFGFLFGPDGVLESKYIEITQSLVDAYRNIGGFTMIKTGRNKIDSENKPSE